MVDALIGENQAVLKPLGRLFRSVAGLAGSAILGSGRVALMVDLPGAVSRDGSLRAPVSDAIHVLVVDDSAVVRQMLERDPAREAGIAVVGRRPTR